MISETILMMDRLNPTIETLTVPKTERCGFAIIILHETQLAPMRKDLVPNNRRAGKLGRWGRLKEL